MPKTEFGPLKNLFPPFFLLLLFKDGVGSDELIMMLMDSKVHEPIFILYSITMLSVSSQKKP